MITITLLVLFAWKAVKYVQLSSGRDANLKESKSGRSPILPFLTLKKVFQSRGLPVQPQKSINLNKIKYQKYVWKTYFMHFHSYCLGDLVIYMEIRSVSGRLSDNLG